jgi:hypothetical protein
MTRGSTLISKAVLSAWLLGVLGLSACDKENAAVSGPGECRQFTQQNLAVLRSKGDLESARTLREILIQCDLSRSLSDEALSWARIAADLGNEDDKQAYEDMKNALKKTTN